MLLGARGSVWSLRRGRCSGRIDANPVVCAAEPRPGGPSAMGRQSQGCGGARVTWRSGWLVCPGGISVPHCDLKKRGIPSLHSTCLSWGTVPNSQPQL